MPVMAIPRKVRKSPRAQVSLVARYRSPTAFEYVQEECHDLSLGGMFIRSRSPAPAGTLIKLECDVTGGSGPIRGVARVVWLRDSPVNGQPAGMGVKFVKLEAGGRDAIKSILDQLGAESEDEGSSLSSDAPEERRIGRNEGLAAQHAADDETALADRASSEHQRGDRDTEPGDEAINPDTQASASFPAGETSAVRSSGRSPKIADSKWLAYGVVAILIAVGCYAFFASRARDERRPTDVAVKAQPRRAQQATARTEPATRSAPAVATVPSNAPAAAAASKYVLDVITNPGGATVKTQGRVSMTPVRLEFASLAQPIELAIERDGFEPATMRVDQHGFAFEEDAWHRRLVLTLTPAAKQRKTRKVAAIDNAKPASKKPTASAKPGTAAPKLATARAAGAQATSDARLKTAVSCLSRGDNRCVVQTLEGKASTAREFEMLVETYRATGNAAKARKAMRAYVGRYPTGDRAAGYRQVLDRQDKQADNAQQ